MKKIKFYKTQSGKVPVKEFLDSLSSRDAQKVIWVLELIEKLNQVPTQYFKKLKNADELWEIRARAGSNSFLILGFLDHGELIILTNGFSKKSQKTPKKEIKLAEQRKADYLFHKREKL